MEMKTWKHGDIDMELCTRNMDMEIWHGDMDMESSESGNGSPGDFP
jgi:hypothetical protein